MDTNPFLSVVTYAHLREINITKKTLGEGGEYDGSSRIELPFKPGQRQQALDLAAQALL